MTTPVVNIPPTPEQPPKKKQKPTPLVPSTPERVKQSPKPKLPRAVSPEAARRRMTTPVVNTPPDTGAIPQTKNQNPSCCRSRGGMRGWPVHRPTHAPATTLKTNSNSAPHKNQKRISPRLPRRRAGSRRSSGVTAPNGRSCARPAQRILPPIPLTPRAAAPPAAAVGWPVHRPTHAPATSPQNKRQQRPPTKPKTPRAVTLWRHACLTTPVVKPSPPQQALKTNGNNTPPQNQKPLVPSLCGGMRA